MREFTEITKDEYAKCVVGGGEWLQSVEFANFKSVRGWLNYFLAEKIDGEISQACVISEKNGRFYLEMSEISDLEFIKFIEEFVRDKKGSSFSFFPKVIESIRDDNLELVASAENLPFKNSLLKLRFRYFSGFIDGFASKVNTLIYRKNLSNISNEEELMASYKKNTRNEIRKCQKIGLEFCELSRNDLPKIAEIFNSSNNKNGTTSKSLQYYFDFFDVLSGIAKFYGIRHGEDIVCVGSFIRSAGEMIYFEGGADWNFFELNAPTFLQHEIMKMAVANGDKFYNFYGISGDASSGVLKFKTKFKGEVIEYVGEFRKDYNIRKLLNSVFR